MTQDNPLISVLISAYNHEEYIERCLDSVLEDDYPNKELIIIDDGSKDNTAGVIQKWVDANKDKIKIIYKSRENRGLCATTNELYGLSNGEFRVELASDDYLINNGISRRYEYLANNPDKMAVFGDCTVVDEHNKLIHESGLSDLYKTNKINLLTDSNMKTELIRNWGVAGSVLMERSEINSVIGDMDETLEVEDRDYYLRMMSKNLLGFIDEPVSAYRWHSQNTFNSDSDTRDRIMNDIAKSALKNMKYFNWREKVILFDQYTYYRHLLLTKNKGSRDISTLTFTLIRKVLRIYKKLFFKELLVS